MVSNQSGVARGLLSRRGAAGGGEAACAACWRSTVCRWTAFTTARIIPDGTVPEYAIECDCRKPAPGLILQAAAEHDIDLERSWLIGDILNDVEAGRRAGCRTILIDNGNETEWQLSPQRLPHHVAADLLEAAAYCHLAWRSSRECQPAGTEGQHEWQPLDIIECIRRHACRRHRRRHAR